MQQAHSHPARSDSASVPQGLLLYIGLVVLLAIGAIILVSQRAQIVREGHETASLRREAVQMEATASRLRLRLASLKSAEHLAAEARRLQLDLVPPEDRTGPTQNERTAQP